MTDDRNRIDLNRLFESTQQKLVAELIGVRLAVDHSATLGEQTEVAWLNFLNSILPNRYQACDGFVVDADGYRSDQIDVLVFDRQYSPPLFQTDNVQYVPAESVYAAFEVKQRINADSLKAASQKVASVRRLRRTTARIQTAEGELPPKKPHRILGGILALSIAKPQTFEVTTARRMARYSDEERLDLG